MKNELEICVKSLDSREEVVSKLEDLGFVVKEDFIMDDTYYVHDSKEISLENSNELLSNYILIREVVGRDVTLVLKEKKFDENGNIISQSSCKCPVTDKEKSRIFIESLGYKELLKLNDHNTLMSNGINEIYVQDVEDLGVYLEMEQKNIHSDNNNGKDIDEMVNNFNSYNLNIEDGNYFVKKSYDMLKKVMKK